MYKCVYYVSHVFCLEFTWLDLGSSYVPRDVNTLRINMIKKVASTVHIHVPKEKWQNLLQVFLQNEDNTG